MNNIYIAPSKAMRGQRDRVARKHDECVDRRARISPMSYNVALREWQTDHATAIRTRRAKRWMTQIRKLRIKLKALDEEIYGPEEEIPF